MEQYPQVNDFVNDTLEENSYDNKGYGVYDNDDWGGYDNKKAIKSNLAHKNNDKDLKNKKTIQFYL